MSKEKQIEEIVHEIRLGVMKGGNNERCFGEKEEKERRLI